MKKAILFFTVLILFPLTAHPFELNINGGRLSIQADNEPLRNILQTLADQGITVHADPGINPSVTVSFADRKIEKGLKILFRNLDHTLIWNSVDTPAGEFIRLKEIYLFLPGRRELTEPLSPKTRILAKNPHDGSIYIKNEILLRLSEELDLTKFRNFLMDNGLTVSGYNRIAGAIKIILPENSDYFEMLEIISKYPGVEKAEPNYAYPVNHPFFIPGQAGKIPASASASSSSTVPIAVVDSGLSPDYLSASYVTASFNSLDPDEPVSDPSGHGTQMVMIAGGAIIPAGADYNSDTFNPVIAIKGFDEDGYISNYDLLNGVEFAINNGARVISLSWGSETESKFLEEAFDYAASKGMIILGAAGNEATGIEMYPAAYDSVIGVGALDPRGKKWDKSNYGDFVTVYAPGFASLPVGYNGEPGTYAGTSISTAYTANLIAGYLSKNPDTAIKEVLTALSEKFLDGK